MEHKMLFLICASGEVFILPANSQSPKFLKRIQEKTNKQTNKTKTKHFLRLYKNRFYSNTWLF